jgi:hypothetical protein
MHKSFICAQQGAIFALFHVKQSLAEAKIAKNDVKKLIQIDSSGYSSDCPKSPSDVVGGKLGCLLGDSFLKAFSRPLQCLTMARARYHGRFPLPNAPLRVAGQSVDQLRQSLAGLRRDPNSRLGLRANQVCFVPDYQLRAWKVFWYWQRTIQHQQP